jgi:hypothetical protein
VRKLYSPENEAELAVIRSILDGEAIEYFVHNDHYGSLQIGPKIDLFNAKTIMVPESQYERAQEITNDFLIRIRETREPFRSSYSLMDKIRMFIEFICFAWVIPGNRWQKRKKPH